MKECEIFHNPRCSKSRQTLALLEGKGVKVKVIKYLEDPPKLSELKSLAKKLNLKPSDFIRKKEAMFTKMNLAEAKDDELLLAMSENPILIERPIVICSEKAVIGRPPENIEIFFS